MSLRPRYSLLTLLILTALVAGGVKIGYGPHHVVMSDPPTREERWLLDLLPFSVDLQDKYQPVVYEYEYVREWNNSRYLYVKGHSTRQRPITMKLLGNNPREALLYLHFAEWPESPEEAAESAKDEQIVCWLYQMNDSQEPFAAGRLQQSFPYSATKIYQAKQIFFLTKRRQIFQFADPFWAAVKLQRVELDEIDDAAFRGQVAAELTKIPDPQ